MKVLYKASFVFLLIDIFSKSPILNAQILCNGKQNPYTRKDSGHYVFSNLYPQKYRIDIICKGYEDVKLELEVKENETKVIIMDLPYSIDNEGILKNTRFQFQLSDKGEIIKNTPVRLRLTSGMKFLKMVKKLKAKEEEIKLNTTMSLGLMNQKYFYLSNGYKYEMFVQGYDNDVDLYILKEPSKYDVAPGGEFQPFWDLKTDSQGRVVMPLLRQFMTGDNADFEISYGNRVAEASLKIKGKESSGEVMYVDVKNFKDAPPPPPEPPVHLDESRYKIEEDYEGDYEYEEYEGEYYDDVEEEA